MSEPSRRQRRVAQQIHEILGEALNFGVNDPVLSGLTVTDVTIDRELQYATVYVTRMDEEADRKEILQALKRATGFLQREVALQSSLPNVPELRFEWDETLEQAQRIEDILDNLDIPPDEPPQDEQDEESR